MNDCKETIRSLRFVKDLHTGGFVNERAFAELCDALRNLATAWRRETLVEKNLVLALYETSTVVRNVADQLARDRLTSEADDVHDKWIVLDRLISECLLPERSNTAGRAGDGA